MPPDSTAKTWFVQTEFGTTLGPMPDDALLEMTRTGALLRTDRLRSDRDGEWRLAAEIPGLFQAVATLPLCEAPCRSGTIVEVPPVEPPSLRPTLAPSPSHLIPPKAPASPESPVDHPEAVEIAAPALTELEPQRVASDPAPTIAAPREVPLSSTAPAENDLISAWKSERRQSQEDLGLVSLAAEITQSEEVEDFAPELPADLLNDEPPVAEEAPASSQRPTNRTAINRPAFLDQIAGLEDGPRLRPETARQKWDRWRRSLPSWPIPVAILLVLWMGWTYWPRSQRTIYNRYVAIWAQWQTRRTDFKDSEGWATFLKQTESELDGTVPWLEKHARANDREKLLLLWIGRDCFRKMLKRPREIGTPEEKQLRILLTNLREFYESPNGGGLVTGKNADPERPTAAGAFDPNLGRAETKALPPDTTAAPENSAAPPAEALDNPE